MTTFHSETLLSQTEVAEIFGVSKSRISQIELGALEKIRLAVLRDPELRGWVRDEVWQVAVDAEKRI